MIPDCKERGVEYIEVRSLDLDPFLPVGIDEDGIRFLDMMMIACLLESSPPMAWDEFRRVQTTRNQIAERGREPGLVITKADGTRCSIERCGLEFIKYLEPLADALARRAQVADASSQTMSCCSAAILTGSASRDHPARRDRRSMASWSTSSRLQ